MCGHTDDINTRDKIRLLFTSQNNRFTQNLACLHSGRSLSPLPSPSHPSDHAMLRHDKEWSASLRTIPVPLHGTAAVSPRDATLTPRTANLTRVTLLSRASRSSLLWKGSGPEPSGVKGEPLWWQNYHKSTNTIQTQALTTWRQAHPESPRQVKAFYSPRRFPIVCGQASKSCGFVLTHLVPMSQVPPLPEPHLSLAERIAMSPTFK